MKKLILTIAALATMSTSSFAQLGSADKDLVYTPVTPCRVLDTRTTQGGTGAIAANSSKHFKVWGQTSFAAQGGAATNCGLTAGNNVAAVAMNFTVVTPAAGGFITAYPFGGALPVAATVNFQVGDIARGDFTIAKVTQTGSAATNHLSVFSTSLADVVGDVVGYYSKPVSTALTCTTTTAVSSAIATISSSGLYYGFAIPAPCPAGTAEVSMRCSTNNAQASASIYDITGNLSSEQCAGQSPVNTYLVRANRVCCNLPGR